jgi:proteasome assembly chaperone (PAC2) family protein
MRHSPLLLFHNATNSEYVQKRHKQIVLMMREAGMGHPIDGGSRLLLCFGDKALISWKRLISELSGIFSDDRELDVLSFGNP